MRGFDWLPLVRAIGRGFFVSQICREWVETIRDVSLRRWWLCGYRIARGELVSPRGIRSSTSLVRLAADEQPSRQKGLRKGCYDALEGRLRTGIRQFHRQQPYRLRTSQRSGKTPGARTHVVSIPSDLYVALDPRGSAGGVHRCLAQRLASSSLRFTRVVHRSRLRR